MPFFACCDCLQASTKNETAPSKQEIARSEEPHLVREESKSEKHEGRQPTVSAPKRIGYGFDGVFHTCVKEEMMGYPRRPEGLQVDDLVRNVFTEIIEQIRRQHAEGNEIYIVTNIHGKDSPDVDMFLERVGLAHVIPKERRLYDAWQSLRGKAEFIESHNMDEFYDDSSEEIRSITNMKMSKVVKSNVKLYLVLPENSKTSRPVAMLYDAWRALQFPRQHLSPLLTQYNE